MRVLDSGRRHAREGCGSGQYRTEYLANPLPSRHAIASAEPPPDLTALWSAEADTPPPPALARDRPDATYGVVEDGALSALASLWWREVPSHDGLKTGALGHFFCADEDAGAEIVEHGLRRLGAEGCQCALAPMDGNTWRSYRCVVEANDRPPFFLDPWTSPIHAEVLRGSGFDIVAHFLSSVAQRLDIENPRSREAEARLAGLGVAYRCPDPGEIDRELARVYRLSLESFAHNAYYTPISEADFLALYDPIRDMLRPDLILLAQRGGELAGFMFAIPDYCQRARARRSTPWSSRQSHAGPDRIWRASATF